MKIENNYRFQTGPTGTGKDTRTKRAINQPTIGIYAGGGASHSWLWFTDLLERFGFYHLIPLDEEDFKSGALAYVDILCMSGGDTFRIAESLGIRGAKNLEAFIGQGGVYMGSCAGAYLPLRSSKSPLDLFNFVNVRISNLTKVLPRVKTLPHKFCTPYGCEYVFHPVRDEVQLKTNGFEPFSSAKTVVAPLYGGPPMIPDQSSCQILATYSGFTNKTIFLVDDNLARQTLMDKAAVIRKEMESGVLYLFGPHFEHPRFPVANQLLINLINWEMRRRKVGIGGEPKTNDHEMVVSKKFTHELKRHLSNCRIVATGLEMRPIRWVIGKKTYEPAKIRVFLDSIWSRINRLEKYNTILCNGEHDTEVLSKALWLTKALRQLKREVDKGLDCTGQAEEIFKTLNELSAGFLKIYFKTALTELYSRSL